MLLEEGVPYTRLRGRNPTKERTRNRRHLGEKPLNGRSDSLYGVVIPNRVAGPQGRQVYFLHDYKIVTIPAEGAVDGGDARSRFILLGKSVEEVLSTGLGQKVIVAVLDEQGGPFRQVEIEVVGLAPLG